MDESGVIEVAGLTKDFGEVRAVDDLTFRVERGAVCGLLGPNGAGKTTTLRMLVGLVRPTSGSARVLGVAMTPSAPVLSRVGSMIDPCGFVPYLSGRRNLRLHWEQSGRELSEGGLEEALAVANLGDVIERKVKTYSRGMRRRLGIARAILGRPEVVILDEPTRGLDTVGTRDVWALLARLSGQGVTVLVASRVLADVERGCSHLLIVHQGRLVADGTITELSAPGTSVFLGVDDVEHARRLLVENVGVRSVRSRGTGLLVEPGAAQRWELVAELVRGGVRVDVVESSRLLDDAFPRHLDEGESG